MIKLNVTGMSCGHCQAAVKGALEEVPGVAGVSVDLAGGTSEVEGNAALEALVAAVEEAGYSAAAAA